MDVSSFDQVADADILSSARGALCPGGLPARLASMSRTNSGSMMSAEAVERAPRMRGSPSSNPKNLKISARNMVSLPGFCLCNANSSWLANALKKTVILSGGRF